MKHSLISTTLSLLIFNLSMRGQELSAFHPGVSWPDVDGHHIQAHGGGIIKLGKMYYWYGEQRSQGLDSNQRYVSCYSSGDLLHWTFRGNALQITDPENLGPHWVLERPKVYYNTKTRKYVMYFHLDDHTYKLAKVGIAISDQPAGPFRFVKSFRPLDHESRDIGQFIDDDGTAYLVFGRRGYCPLQWFVLCHRLSADGMARQSQQICNVIHAGGAVVGFQRYRSA